MSDNQHKGWVFNIQRYSTQDGPGIRTTVFLKGCPLVCHWCSNCESQSPQQDLLFFSDRCDPECDHCVQVCPEGAIEMRAGGHKEIARSRCSFCALPMRMEIGREDSGPCVVPLTSKASPWISMVRFMPAVPWWNRPSTSIWIPYVGAKRA